MTKGWYRHHKGLLEIFDEEMGLALSGPFAPMHFAGVLDDKHRREQWRHEGVVYREAIVNDAGQLDGECREVDEQGGLRSVSFYCEDKLHGPANHYSKSGSLLSKGWWWKGQRQGLAHWYYDDGRLASLQRFKDGRWHHLQEFFYRQGHAKSLLGYQHGLLHGESLLYHSDGTLACYYLYDKGKLLEMKLD